MKNYSSVVCFVESSKGILFCKREDNGLWELPGGRVEKNESFLNAAKRELFEETGIQSKSQKLIGEWKIKKRIAAVILCEDCLGELTPSWESPQVAFIKNFKTDKRVYSHTRGLLNEIKKSKSFFQYESKKFEKEVIVRYAYGRIKRKIRQLVWGAHMG